MTIVLKSAPNGVETAAPYFRSAIYSARNLRNASKRSTDSTDVAVGPKRTRSRRTEYEDDVDRHRRRMVSPYMLSR